jgi:hypothetical protein
MQRDEAFREVTSINDRPIQFAYLAATASNRFQAGAVPISLNAPESIMAQPNAEDVVNAIASDTNTPTETVSKMYADTWAAYSDGAQIMDYLPVLVARRVRENLRSTPAR